MKNSTIITLLHSEFTEPVRDPLWKHIYLSRGLKKIISRPEFQLLGRIKQLGPAFHVYPGAVHTRLNHSLGVFHVAVRMLFHLAGRPDSPELEPEEARAFLCAALLHDLGHFPFAHSLKELPLKPHEVLGGEIILAGSMAKIIRQELGADPEVVAAIIDQAMPINSSGGIKGGNQGNIPFYRNLLSGVLDPDKLDYLNRDAYFCGVPYGTQDIDFVISKTLPHSSRGIALREAGVTAVENILFSKYLMYRTVYWHRTVRIATAMIKKALFLGMKETVIQPNDLYYLDDDAFFRLLGGAAFRPFSLAEKVLNRDLYKTAFEGPVELNNSEHTRLFDLDTRNQRETELIREISTILGRKRRPLQPEEVILDIPEPIQFEIDLPFGGRLKETQKIKFGDDEKPAAGGSPAKGQPAEGGAEAGAEAPAEAAAGEIPPAGEALTGVATTGKPITGKPITGEFGTGESVFTKPVVENFTNSLRKMRLFLPLSAVEEIRADSKKQARLNGLFLSRP